MPRVLGIALGIHELQSCIYRGTAVKKKIALFGFFCYNHPYLQKERQVWNDSRLYEVYIVGVNGIGSFCLGRLWKRGGSNCR